MNCHNRSLTLILAKCTPIDFPRARIASTYLWADDHRMTEKMDFSENVNEFEGQDVKGFEVSREPTDRGILPGRYQ